jgi:hypothetical protein
MMNMYKYILTALLAVSSWVFGNQEATVTWDPSPDPLVTRMRIYQIVQGEESVAGYYSFPYTDLSGTFELAEGCVQVYGRAYAPSSGLVSDASNMLAIPCICPECSTPGDAEIPTAIPPGSQEALITGISADTLSFNATSGTMYEVYGRQNLSSGTWEFIGILSAAADGTMQYPIDTSLHDSCFYTVRPR